MEKIFSLLTLLLASGFAIAGDSGVYAGVAVGRSSINFNSTDFDSPSPSNAGFEGPTIGKDAAYKFFVGYYFDKTWAIEGGYTHHGKFQFSSTDLDHGVTIFDYSASSWSLAGTGHLPVSERVSLFAKLGVSVNTAKNNYWVDGSHALLLPLPYNVVPSHPALTSLISPGNYSKTTTSPLLGVGLEYAAWKDVKLRLDYENYGKFGEETSTGRASLSTTSLGVSYMF